MKKIEGERLDYIGQVIVAYSAWTAITGFTRPPEEDFKISDLWIDSTGNTAYPLEGKSVLGGFTFKEDGEFRCYWTGGCPKSIFSKFGPDTTIPTGTPVYFLNAETENGSFEGCKWDKMMKDEKSCLAILAKDGIILFSHKTLKDAFMDFAYYWVSHTTEFGLSGKRKWERKAVIDLSKGLFLPCDTPDRLLEKKYN